MGKHNCEKCKFRGKYDKAPGSVLGRLWRWHINWCPGWRGYMNSLPDTHKAQLIKKYKLDRNV